MNSKQAQGLSAWLVFLMAFAIGITVASNYYAQPLLHSITDDLHNINEWDVAWYFIRPSIRWFGFLNN